MSTSLELPCQCGSFVARATDVSSTRWNRLVCYCDDCQAFPRHLGQAEVVLDELGGTDILQTSPARLQIVSGKEHLACLRLAPRGIGRWYARCCKTPIANTAPTGQIPFTGIILRHKGPNAALIDDGELGAVRAHIFARYAKGSAVPANATPGAGLSLLLPMLPQILLARLRGEHAQSPFFDADGQFAAEPHLLTAAERTAAGL